MNIGIVGLGLIGGSLAKAIKANTQHRVYGTDVNEKTTAAALSEGCVDVALDESNLSHCDVVMVALYPQATIDYLKRSVTLMKKGAIIVDCAGVKKRITEEVRSLVQNLPVHFIGGHPMAGIEKSGFENSFSQLFSRAPMILCKSEESDDEATKTLEALFLSMGFGYVNISTPEEHDHMIAYTSQLAHIVSSAYIKSESAERHRGFSAGSFKDLTRVAKLNETMWTELFFENRELLLAETDAFMSQLANYRKALAEGNYEDMKKLLKEGRIQKESVEKEEGAN